jgi:hypothetical protein
MLALKVVVRWRSIVLFLMLISLSGCGIAGVCGNSCPAGWVHGSADCGCMEVSKKSPSHSEPVQPNAFSITRRYFCVDVANNSDRASCDVTVNAKSCSEAMQGVRDQLSEVSDPCTRCSGIVDNTRRWNNQHNDIQGGPCQGWTRADSKRTLARGELLDPAPVYPPAINASLVSRKAFTGFLHIMRSVAAAPPDNSVASCRVECSANTSFCLSVQIEDQNAKGLRLLQKMAFSKPPVIPAADLRRMFGMTKDDCERGDTIISSGRVSNLGGACSMVVETPITKITVNVPELITGRRIDEPGMAAVLFEDPTTQASLHFSDAFLDSDWGGQIVNMFTEQNYVGFATGKKSCIRATLK